MSASKPSKYSPANESQNEQKPLINLPAEVLDLIVEHVLNFPGRSTFDGSTRRTTAELLSHPILRTSKQLRHHALTILVERCLWIRFTYNSVEMWHSISEFIPEYPSLADVHRPILQAPGLQTFDIYFEAPDSNSEAKALWKSTQTFFMFPFSSQGWFEFVDLLHEIVATTRDISPAVTLRCESNSPATQESLNTFILPSLLKYRPLQALERFTAEGAGLNHLSEEDKERPCHLINLKSGTGLLRGLLDQAEEFQSRDRKIDAAYTMLHANNIYVKTHRWLRHVLGRRRVIAQDHNSDTKVWAKSNEQYCLINKVQFQIALSLYCLYKVKTKSWLQENIHLAEYAAQWVHDVDFSWVGLRCRELAQKEFASALTLLIEGALLDEVDHEQADPTDVAKRFHTTHRRIASSMSAHAVSKLWPEMPERRLLEEMGCDPVTKHTLDTSIFFVQVHKAGGTDFMWSGHPKAMNRLGNETELRHLWRYRPRLTDRTDDVEQYCDLDCRCIVY